MPAKHRRLVRELSQTDDLAEIIQIANEVISDIGQRIKAQTGADFHIQIWWFLRDQYAADYDAVPWPVDKELRNQRLSVPRLSSKPVHSIICQMQKG